MSEKFDLVMSYFGKMAGKIILPILKLFSNVFFFLGDEHIGFNNSVFLSERDTADRNFALAYFMKVNIHCTNYKVILNSVGKQMFPERVQPPRNT